MKKAALVLSGGGARGIAHIGDIEELLQRKVDIKAIAGTSMGAVVGGVYAAGKLFEFKEWLLTLDKRKVIHLVDFTFSGQGLIKGDRVFNTMREFIEDVNIEDLPIPYSATATDILNRKEVVFKKGSLFDAMRASVSIPTVFTPFELNKKLLVDGGVVNNIPVSNVTKKNGDKLVVSNVNAIIPPFALKSTKAAKEKKESAYQARMKQFQKHLQKINPINSKDNDQLGFFSLIDKTLSFMMQSMAELHMEKFEPDMHIKISRDTCSTFDFFKAEELIEVGKLATRKAFEEMD